MPAGAGDADPLTIHPAPGAWARLAGARRSDGRAGRFRAQLGLPADGPIVMSGHQAGVWHAGIAAKYIAATAAAGSLGGSAAWLVVDQDANDPALVRYPVRAADGRLEARVWDARAGAAPGTPAPDDGPTGARPPFAVADPPALGEGESPAAPSVADGLRRIALALRARQSSRSAADQAALAAADLLRPVAGDCHLVHATAIGRTDLFAGLVERMRRDPGGCVEAYNGAIAAAPAAGIAPLAADSDAGRAELPLWRIVRAGPGGAPARRRVWSDELGDIPTGELAPRALLMTGTVRLAGCELFIHGLGGAGDPRSGSVGYDAITERWFRSWLGVDLAPMVLVTATLRLDLGREPATARDVARARWEAHRARHDPAMLGDERAAAHKRRLLGQIAALRREGRDASAPFFEMHRLLERARRDRAVRLAELDTRASDAAAALAEADLLADRTWAFPLHPPERLGALAAQVRRAIEGR